MSVVFQLNDCPLSLEAWNGLLEEWAGERPEGGELYDEAVFETSGGERIAFVWGPGSIRGVVLTRDDDGAVGMRFSALASRTDYAMGYDIMRRALAGGGTLIHEQGETYSVAMLDPQRARDDAAKDFCASARSFRTMAQEKAAPLSLPVGAMTLDLSPDDLPDCTDTNVDTVQDTLAKRIEKYGHAYRGMTMGLTGGLSMGSWALIPSMVHDVDLVSIDWKDTIVVPLKKVCEVLGERAEVLGDVTYLPELTAEADAATLAALEAEAVDVRAYIAEHGQVVEGGACGAEDPAGAPGEGDEGAAVDEDELAHHARLTKSVVALIMENMFGGGDPDDLKEALVKTGLDAEVVEGMLTLTALAMRGLIEERKEAGQVFEELQEQGLPAPVAEAILEAIFEAVEKRQSEDDEEDGGEEAEA